MILFLLFMKAVGFISWHQFVVIAAFEILCKISRNWRPHNEN